MNYFRLIFPLIFKIEINYEFMVCFLAFVLEVVMMRRRLKEAGFKGSYREVMEDVERIKAVEVKVDGKRYLVRTELEGIGV